MMQQILDRFKNCELQGESFTHPTLYIFLKQLHIQKYYVTMFLWL